MDSAIRERDESRAAVAAPTIPLVGGPYGGRRRPIVEGPPPERVEMPAKADGMIEVYRLMMCDDGALMYRHAGQRALAPKK